MCVMNNYWSVVTILLSSCIKNKPADCMILLILMLGFKLGPLDSIAALMKIMQIFLTDIAVRKSDGFGIFLISALPNSGSQYSGPKLSF